MADKMGRTEARQGSKGTPVLIVLACALALVVIGYFATGLIGYSNHPGDGMSDNGMQAAPRSPAAAAPNDQTLVTPDQARAQNPAQTKALVK